MASLKPPTHTPPRITKLNNHKERSKVQSDDIDDVPVYRRRMNTSEYLARAQPSVFTAVFDIIKSIIKPSIILVLAVIAFVSFSDNDDIDIENDKDNQLALNYPTVIEEDNISEDEKEAFNDHNIEDIKDKIKFIAGLITVHRPNIPDCGLVARHIVELSRRRKADPFLIAAIISVESRFGADSRSHVGATGLMQLMPGTAKVMDLNRGRDGNPALTDVKTNIQLGIDYYKRLENQYYGNKFLALSAYNWGPANVNKVKNNPALIPGSVRKYANTVIERSINWSNHYKKANEGATSVDVNLEKYLAEERR